MQRARPHRLTTANWRIEVSDEGPVNADRLGLDTDALVMGDSPSVLWLWRLCMKKGCKPPCANGKS